MAYKQRSPLNAVMHTSVRASSGRERKDCFFFLKENIEGVGMCVYKENYTVFGLYKQ
ncbi:MAG: hypothetical protein JWM56_340 [Candidatus Peribacteria bacterium]|nr:hypothetical protein [Candidatus Peribacteria bacterium]